MINVYLVTAGSYSDYGIHGVFSTREKAKEFIKNAQSIKDNSNIDDEEPYISYVYWANKASIEEWPLDTLLNNKVQRVYSCGMLLDDGSVVEPSNPEYSHYVWENPFRGEIEQFNVKVPVYNNRPIVRTRSTVSVDHAVKLAAEKRQEWLRNRVHKNPNSEDAQ